MYRAIIVKRLPVIFFIAFLFSYGARSEKTLQTIWGPVKINQELLEKLLETPALERLKGVDQSGPLPYFGYTPYFSRYDHSIGVLALLILINAPLAQQVAGLLHDISHTAFSHIGDHLFYKENQTRCYQDIIHLPFLKTMGIPPLTKRYGIELSHLDPDRYDYTALEKPLPDLCADRIQYIVHTGVVWGQISEEEGKRIIYNLRFREGRWFFTDVEQALKFAKLSLYFTQYLWGAEYNYALYVYFAELLKYAVDKKIILEDDLRFGGDHLILDKLKARKDPFVQKKLKICGNIHAHYKIVAFGEGKWNTKPKFRGVDPCVKHGDDYKKLSEINPAFKKKFEAVNQWCQKGYGINPLTH